MLMSFNHDNKLDVKISTYGSLVENLIITKTIQSVAKNYAQFFTMLKENLVSIGFTYITLNSCLCNTQTPDPRRVRHFTVLCVDTCDCIQLIHFLK